MTSGNNNTVSMVDRNYARKLMEITRRHKASWSILRSCESSRQGLHPKKFSMVKRPTIIPSRKVFTVQYHHQSEAVTYVKWSYRDHSQI